jgi:hypothetical protein
LNETIEASLRNEDDLNVVDAIVESRAHIVNALTSVQTDMTVTEAITNVQEAIQDQNETLKRLCALLEHKLGC